MRSLELQWLIHGNASWIEEHYPFLEHLCFHSYEDLTIDLNKLLTLNRQLRSIHLKIDNSDPGFLQFLNETLPRLENLSLGLFEMEY